MTPADIDRVFGRRRLRMVTGDHVEVFREEALPGERRRYTKRFLATSAGDFREWTEREWRILARLVGHGIKPVPDVVQFDRGSADRPALVQTYDAGVTVDHWATLLPLERDGSLLRNVFADCAHWWALARHSLVALDAIHELRLVHLDLKADNICIPIGPADFDPLLGERWLHPRFEDITLIDFAFSLVSGEHLQSALPIAAQPDYEYQSPRLLRALDAGRLGNLAPTRQLDWRCDLYSLAAMLRRYLPEVDDAAGPAWTRRRHAKARALVRRLIELHDRDLPSTRPHAELIAQAGETLAQPDLRQSLQRGWTLAIEAGAAAGAAPTPVTRIAPPLVTPASPPIAFPGPTPFSHAAMRVEKSDIDLKASARLQRQGQHTRKAWWAVGLAAAAAASAYPVGQALLARRDAAAASVVRVARADALRPQTDRPATPPVAPAQTASSPSAAVPTPPPPLAAAQIATPRQLAAAPIATPPLAAAEPAQVAPKPAPLPFPRQGQSRAVAATTRGKATPSSSASSRPLPFAAASASGQRGRASGAVRTAGSSATSRASTSRNGSRPIVSAVAFPSRQTLLAQARVQALVQAQASVQRHASTPARTQVQTQARGGDDAYPWAVAGRTPPQVALAQPLPALVAPAADASPARGAAGPAAATAAAPTVAAAPATTPLLTVSAPLAENNRNNSATAAAPPDFGARADDLMLNHMPRLAQHAERLVSRALFIAGRSANVIGDPDILDAAAAIGRPAADPVLAMAASPRDAQLLNDAARNEFARRGATSQAVMLQVRAFGANPLDPEVAGYLAFLLLRQHPVQAEPVRQLALYALTLRDPRNPRGRAEDWATLAVANALSGRERDARNAWLVSLSLAPSLDRQCRAAIDAYAMHGERLRAPVEAMLYSAHASGRSLQSSFCEWPPHWTVSSGSMR